MSEFLLRKDGLAERTRVRSSLTNEETWYESDPVNYDDLPQNMKWQIQKIEPVIEDNILMGIRLSVENLNSEINTKDVRLRQGSR